MTVLVVLIFVLLNAGIYFFGRLIKEWVGGGSLASGFDEELETFSVGVMVTWLLFVVVCLIGAAAYDVGALFEWWASPIKILFGKN